MKPDYYSILEVTKQASPEEIKSAFRKMAMLHHPDKNPGNPAAEEKFRLVMEAYDVLIDPERKRKYDSGRSYHSHYARNSSAFKTTQNKRKDYSFTGEDFRSRQEFNEQYRKHQRQKQKNAAKQEDVPSYSDFKYIMISIPLAVALLFFIINASHREEKKRQHPGQAKLKELNTQKNKGATEIAGKQDSTLVAQDKESVPGKDGGLDMNISPWNKIFGYPVYDTTSKAVLKIENRSGTEAVVCLYDIRKARVIRNNFMNTGYYILLGNIPKGKYYLKTVYGKNWTAGSATTELTYEGTFDSVYLYAKMKKAGEIIEVTGKNLRNGDTILRELPPYLKIPPGQRVSNYDFFWKN